MGNQFEVEPLGEHEYLLRARSATQVVETHLRLNEDDLARLELSDVDEGQVARATSEFLAERQPEPDLPMFVELNDIAASYDDFGADLRRRVTS